jgi:hypothetical protein
MGPCPAKKAFARQKEGGGSSFPGAGFRRFSPAIPLSPHLFAESKRGDSAGISQPFLASAPAFFPGQQENGSERPINLEMVQK